MDHKMKLKLLISIIQKLSGRFMRQSSKGLMTVTGIAAILVLTSKQPAIAAEGMSIEMTHQADSESSEIPVVAVEEQVASLDAEMPPTLNEYQIDLVQTEQQKYNPEATQKLDPEDEVEQQSAPAKQGPSNTASMDHQQYNTGGGGGATTAKSAPTVTKDFDASSSSGATWGIIGGVGALAVGGGAALAMMGGDKEPEPAQASAASPAPAPTPAPTPASFSVEQQIEHINQQISMENGVSDRARLSITITNNGETAIHALDITNALDSRLIPDGAIAITENGIFSPGDSQIHWSIPALNPNESITVSYEFKLTNNIPYGVSEFNNTVVVSGHDTGTVSDTTTTAIGINSFVLDNDYSFGYSINYDFTNQVRIFGIGDINQDGFDDLLIIIDNSTLTLLNLGSATVNESFSSFGDYASSNEGVTLVNNVPISSGWATDFKAVGNLQSQDPLSLSIARPITGGLRIFDFDFNLDLQDHDLDYDQITIPHVSFGTRIVAVNAGDLNGNGYDDFKVLTQHRENPDNTGPLLTRIYTVYGGESPERSDHPETVPSDSITAWAQANSTTQRAPVLIKLDDYDGNGITNFAMPVLVKGNSVNSYIYTALIFEDDPQSGYQLSIPNIEATNIFLNINGQQVSNPITSEFLRLNQDHFTVHNLGDINNNQFSSIAVAYDPGRIHYLLLNGDTDFYISYSTEKIIWVAHGSHAASDLDLTAMSPDQGFTITSSDPLGSFFDPRTIMNIGDINGDGIDDFAISGGLASPNGIHQAGSVYVIYGNEELADIDLAQLTAAQGFRINGTRENEQLRIDPEFNGNRKIGDINGDGFDDFAVISNTEQGGRTLSFVYGFDSQNNINIQGTPGDDILYGTTENDVIYAGAGDDVIHLSTGNNVIKGGPGRDIFIVTPSEDPQSHAILDFVSGEDKIDLSAFSSLFKSYDLNKNNVLDAIEFVNLANGYDNTANVQNIGIVDGNTVITLNNDVNSDTDAIITLVGVSGGISHDDLIF